ncbi:MAG: hypothetical protein ACYDAY_09455 [Candidatus Dormibacteria bacterium]
MRGVPSRLAARWAAALVAGTTLAGSAGFLLPSPALAAEPYVVGHTPTDGVLLADPGARVLYETKGQLEVRNLDTLAVTQVFKSGDPAIGHGLFEPDGFAYRWDVDPVNHRLFALVQGSPQVHPASGDDTVLSVAVYSVAQHAFTLHVPVISTNTGSVVGISYYPPADKLYISYVAPSPGVPPFIEQRDVPTGHLDWSYNVSNCTQPIPETLSLQSGLYRSLSQPRVNFGCYDRNGATNAVQIDISSGSASSFVTYYYPLGPGHGAVSVNNDRNYQVLADPRADRLTFLEVSSGSSGAWIFDGAHSAFLGLSALDTGSFPVMAGLDPDSGRLYVRSEPLPGTLASSLFELDTRVTPISAGLSFADLGVKSSDSYAALPIVYDSHTGNVIINNTGSYSVMRDPNPILRQQADPNYDQGTSNATEMAGVTQSQFSIHASGYGFRARLVGGLAGVADNATDLPSFWPYVIGGLRNAYPALPHTYDQPPSASSAPLGAGNRDLYLGRVRSVALNQNEANADSIGTDADDQTRTDLYNYTTQPSSAPCPTNPTSTAPCGQSWPVPDSTCHDMSGQKQSAPAQPGSAATCDLKAESVVASAIGGGEQPGALPVSVAGASSTTTLTLDPTRGAVATVDSVAEGVNIATAAGGPAVVSIARVEVISTTVAHGHHGTAVSSFKRTLQGVWVAGTEYCASPCPMGDPQNQVINQINSQFSGKFNISLPAPDPRIGFGTGSPGGARAVVEKELYSALSDATLNGDSDVAVPGMYVIYYNDAEAARSRMIFELAGTEADSSYHVFTLPKPSRYTPVVSIPLQVITSVVQGVTHVTGTQATQTKSAGPSMLPFTDIRIITNTVAVPFRVLTSHPTEVLIMWGVWMFLLAPVYLVVRRMARVRVESSS